MTVNERKIQIEADTPYILYSSEVSLVGENKYAVTVYAWQLINGSLRLIDKFTTPSIPESYALAEFMAPSSSNLKQLAELPSAEYELLKSKAAVYDRIRDHGFCSGCQYQGSCHDYERGCMAYRDFKIKNVKGETPREGSTGAHYLPGLVNPEVPK